MKTFALVLLVIFFSTTAPFATPDQALQRLVSARTLKCEFGPGTAGQWENGQFKVVSGTFGTDGKNGTVHFDSLNIKAGTARAIANGATDVAVQVDAKGLTFVERPDRGVVIVTTVFAAGDGTGAFPAVFSKHIELLTIPLPQQYYGFCRILD